MDFSPKNIGGQKTRYFDSEEESEVQIVFIPGMYNSNLWKHQIKYFSKNYRTITFERDDHGYEEQKKILDSILKKKNMDNVVLVSSGPGNGLVQEFEDRNSTIATVLTSVAEKYPEISENKYSLLKHTVFRKPKITHELFFSEKTSYKIARDLLDDLELPEHDVLESFLEKHEINCPIKPSLIIHPEEDRFASRETACSMKPEAQVSIIKKSGSFSFYEKPEEYNKAVHDFLEKIEEFVRSKKVRETREKNRTLTDFERDSLGKSNEESKRSTEQAVLWE